MSDELPGIDRCYTCGGLLKRLRDFDQAVCRCERPIRPGKKGRAPSSEPVVFEANPQSEEEGFALDTIVFTED